MPQLKVPDAVPGTPFKAIPVVRFPGWKETALWWPEHEALIVAEVVGANELYTGGRGAAGMHPMLRALPPRGLRSYAPRHLLMGHGAGDPRRRREAGAPAGARPGAAGHPAVLKLPSLGRWHWIGYGACG